MASAQLAQREPQFLLLTALQRRLGERHDDAGENGENGERDQQFDQRKTVRV
jgi:hypothetical protein